MKRDSTIRDLIEAQNRRLHSDDFKTRVWEAFFRCGDIGSRLRSLSDRQMGQLLCEFLWDDLVLVSPSMSICTEATERLFRSPAGARAPDEEFNDVLTLPACPKCGNDMLHYIGIDEPDFRLCTSLACRHKIEEPKRD